MRLNPRGASIALAGPLLVLLTLPVIALLVGSSPGRLWSSLMTPMVWQALGLSLKTALIATLFVVVFGTPLAWWLGRSRSRWTQWVAVLADLPLVLPPAVAGVGLLLAFGKNGLVGPWVGDIVFTTTAVVIAQSFVAAPLFLQPATAAFSAFRQTWLDMAEIDGASTVEAWRWLILPLTSSALLAGVAATLGRALGEFGATLIFAGNFPGETQTLPLAIYALLERDLALANDAAIVLLCAGFGLQLVVRSWSGRLVGVGES